MAKKKGASASPFVPTDEQPYSIPENWCWVTIGTIASVKGGKRIPKGKKLVEDKTEHPYIRVTDFDNRSIATEQIKYIDKETFNLIHNYTISTEDIYISIAGTIGKVGIIPDDLDGANLTENAAKITNIKGIKKNFLLWILESEVAQSQMRDSTISTTQPKLALFRVENIKFPLSPLAEQQRIVTRIESLFAKLDEAKEKAQAVVDGFELRKSAILHKAFTGELTAQWRKEHKLGMNSWVDTGFKAVMDVRDGTHDSPKYCDTGYALITSKNLKDGRITDKDLKFISKDDYDKINERSKVDIGDILFAMIGTIGNPVVVEGTPNYSIKNVALFKNIGKVNPYFVKYYLETKEVKDKMDKDAKGSTQRFVSLSYLRNFPIPIPTKAEQIQLVELVDDLIKNEEQAKEAAEAVLGQIDTMKKAILSRAFRGELGTNDPAEEWAGELLKKVL